MATTTTNYGFDVPTSSDLVKNGATAISTLGQDIDTFLFRPFTRNGIINGAFDIWERGTTTTSSGYQTADRWSCGNLGGGTTTFSRESTIVPTGSTYSMKFAQATANGLPVADQVIETLNSVQFAGKTVAVSIQAAASASTTATIELSYSTSTDNPVGGSWTNITATSGGSGTVTTTASFAAITGIYAVPSTAKTLRLRIYTNPLTTGTSFYFGQVQLEVGNQSSPFTRAGGTIQGELAACQRYYYRQNAQTVYNPMVNGIATTATNAAMFLNLPVSLRVAPTVLEYGNLALVDGVSGYTIGGGGITIPSNATGLNTVRLNVNSSGLTTFRFAYLESDNTTNGFLAVSAEL